MRTVITYGTYDLLHYGHIELLRRAKEMAGGGRLIVGVSTDEFNTQKGKTSHFEYSKRKKMVEAIRYVDLVIPEEDWSQKPADIQHHSVDLFVMGDDWQGEFDDLSAFCEVAYISRTPEISSTVIKQAIHQTAPKNKDAGHE